jgi:Ni/Fe-hydrogenase subunit HybB-like protein
MNGSVKKNVPFFSFGTLIVMLVFAIGAYAALYRFQHGLGASTHLTDDVPWGLWIAFDVLAGVALAAGGFSITAAVYVFNMKKYKPIARPAILTAFIGYLLVVIGIVIDIGQPMRFWHPLVMWQHHSVMFEVVWCITLYSTVLGLEFAPAFLERLKLNFLLKVLKFFMFPLVIAGIVLSFLHQSSMGGFFLIMPAKVNPLWYSSNLPYLFYISAIAVGLAMVSFESVVSAWAFKREQERDILTGLGKGIAITLVVYVVAKVGDLAYQGALSQAFSGTIAGKMFLLELIGGFILPLVLLALPAVRQSVSGVFFSAVLVIAGVMLNRFNTIFFAQLGNGVSYLPSSREIAITLGLIALGVLMFRMAVKFLPIFHEAEAEH